MKKIFHDGIKAKTSKSLIADAYVLEQQKLLNLAFKERFEAELNAFIESSEPTLVYSFIKTNNDGSEKSKEQKAGEITAVVSALSSSAYKKAVSFKASGKGTLTITKRKAVTITDDFYNEVMD